MIGKRRAITEVHDLKIGAISYCYHHLDVRGVLEKFRGIGFQNIELWHGHPGGRADYMKHDRPGAEDTRDLLDGILTRDTGTNAAEIRTELQETMFDLAFVVRTAESLTKMLEILDGLQERYRDVRVTDKGKLYNTDLMEAVELGFLLDNAEPLVAAALARQESRGAHWRDDFPTRDDVNWLKHSLAYREPDGKVRLEFKPVKLGHYVPAERKY